MTQRWRIAVMYEVDARTEQEAWDNGDAIAAGSDDCDATYCGVQTEGEAGRGVLADKLGPLTPESE